MLERSREFKRGVDNAIYHQGYPINYREQRGAPSIQVSIALDGRQADVDVDYRSSSFPVGLFNGHLSAVELGRPRRRQRRAACRAVVRVSELVARVFRRPPGSGPRRRGRRPQPALPKIPRVGKKDIDLMVPDFLKAWLIEGDTVAAMGYVSERSYACLAQDAPDPSAFDRGLAPFQIMVNLKAAQEAIGRHDSLEGLTLGVPLTIPGLRAVAQPHQAQFILYNVSDDVAARFDCEGRLTPGAPTKASRAYGTTLQRPSASPGQPRTRRSRCCGPERMGIGRLCRGRRSPAPDVTPEPPAPPEPKRHADQGRPHTRERGEELHGHLVDPQELRRGVSISFDEKLRVLRPVRVLTRRRQPPSTMPAGGSARASNTSANGSAPRAIWGRS